MTTFRVTIQPAIGAPRVMLIQPPALSVRIATGGVSGPAIPSRGAILLPGSSDGGDPPLPGVTLLAETAELVAQGVDPDRIFYIYTGSEIVDTLVTAVIMPVLSLQTAIDLPVVSAAWTSSVSMPFLAAQPSVAAPVTSSVQGAAVAMPSVSAQPALALPATSSASEGSQTATVAMPAITLQPAITVPAADAVRTSDVTMPAVAVQPALTLPVVSAASESTSTATVAMPTVLAQPIISTPAASSTRTASVSGPTLTVQPAVTAASASSAQTASVSMPAVSVQPSVAVPASASARTAAATMPAVSAQPVVAVPAASCGRTATVAMMGLSLQPALSVPTSSAVRTASENMPAISAQPALALPTVTDFEAASSPPDISNFSNSNTCGLSVTGGCTPPNGRNGWELTGDGSFFSDTGGSPPTTSGYAYIFGNDVWDDELGEYLPGTLTKTLNVAAGNIIVGHTRDGGDVEPFLFVNGVQTACNYLYTQDTIAFYSCPNTITGEVTVQIVAHDKEIAEYVSYISVPIA